MKNRILILILILNTFLLASNVKKETKTDIEIKKQMEREKKYAKEQTFYQGSEYDLKSFEVNPDALKSMPEMDIDYSDDGDVIEMD
ncbi:hypothetical protein SMGD1_1467 [Sulfurimonas gotlandica GD1]|jgi:hypothetical protein|uniref:Uncharacterized protein n=1 Tax=Sulfurimonas gotlandica (strain DSM 19862 / JCM 16533 / GD1) TaxID=929558 RepID=B6BHJ4_SULGG|nr:hypothetical protein [Sulfurimonas gotlandica]EDZ63370.1 hypothetical protein CBGD1_990 [Sulfurimonas gotlandica GD1]EHP29991.1 hypothetical protein SMGD1_1467 [Sulfurimonas gotlandica GD1]